MSRRSNSETSTRGRVVAIVVLLALAAGSCSAGNDDATPVNSTSEDSTGLVAASAAAATMVNDALGGGRGVQDFIVHLDLARVTDTGPVSFYEDVLNVAGEGAGEAMDLPGGFTWSPVDSLDGEVLDADGELLPTISLDFGLLHATPALLESVRDGASDEVLELLDAARTLDVGLFVELTTPDFEQRRVNVQAGDVSRVDLTFVDAIAPGDTLQSVYLFGQSLPNPDTSAEKGLDPHELLVQRWNAGLVRFLQATDGKLAAVTDNTIAVVQGSSLKLQDFKFFVPLGGAISGIGSVASISALLALTPAAAACIAAPVVCGLLLGGGLAFGGLVGGVGAHISNLPDEPSECTLGSDTQPPAEPDPEPQDPAVSDEPVVFLPAGPSINREASKGLGTRSYRTQGRLFQQSGGGSGCGNLSGDVHMRTFDQKRYDNQAVGEFLAFEGGDATIQVRQEPIGDSGRVSVATAVAAQVGDSSVSLHLLDGGSTWIDGQRTAVERGASVAVDDGAVLWTGSGWTIVWADGTTVWIEHHGSHVSLLVRPATPDVAGLFGNLDGNRDNDFATREGSQLSADLERDFEAFYGTFVNSWRITEEESLFQYEEGESTSTFTDLGFPAAPTNIDELDLAARADAETLCIDGGVIIAAVLTNCVLDVAHTGDLSFVLAAMLDQLTARGVSRTELSAGTGAVTAGPARLTEISGADLATGEGLVLVRASDEDGRVILRAFDVETRALRWTVADVDPSCRPVIVDGHGVVARVANSSERLGDDRSALVLLSLVDGSELARFVGDGDDVLVGCAATLNATGDVVIHIANNQARGFRIGDDITLLWRHEFEGPVGGHSPAVDGNFVVTSFLDSEGAVALTSLGAETGDVASSIALPGRFPRTSPAAIEPIGDGLLAISTEGNLNVDAAISLVDASGGELAVTWVQTYGEDDIAAPPHLVRLGDELIGWTYSGGRQQLAGFSVETAELLWLHVPQGGAAHNQVVVFGDDTAVISASPTAWLEYVDGDSRESSVVDLPGNYLQPQQLTVLMDGTLVVTGATNDGRFYLEFIDR
jgi:hypothetical protein